MDDPQKAQIMTLIEMMWIIATLALGLGLGSGLGSGYGVLGWIVGCAVGFASGVGILWILHRLLEAWYWWRNRRKRGSSTAGH